MAAPAARCALLALAASLGPLAVAAYPGPYPPGGSCNVNGGSATQLCIAAPFSSNAVLQRAPAQAAITGSVPVGYGVPGAMHVSVRLLDEDTQRDNVVTAAVRADNTWKVLLPPRPAFGNFSLTASCTAGCAGANASYQAAVVNLTFGDVYVCAGQSNMQLMMDYTFERNVSIAKIAAGKYKNIRLFYGPMNFDFGTNRTDIFVIAPGDHDAEQTEQNKHQLTTGGWRQPADLIGPIPGGHDEPPWYLSTEFGRFYATCWYTFETLTDSLEQQQAAAQAAGTAAEPPPPFGLLAVAVGGTKIAQWVEWGAQAECRNVTCCDTPDCTQVRKALPFVLCFRCRSCLKQWLSLRSRSRRPTRTAPIRTCPSRMRTAPAMRSSTTG